MSRKDESPPPHPRTRALVFPPPAYLATAVSTKLTSGTALFSAWIKVQALYYVHYQTPTHILAHYQTTNTHANFCTSSIHHQTHAQTLAQNLCTLYALSCYKHMHKLLHTIKLQTHAQTVVQATRTNSCINSCTHYQATNTCTNSCTSTSSPYTITLQTLAQALSINSCSKKRLRCTRA